MDKTAIISKINSMLEDMNQTQLQNIYDYACKEFGVEGHEGSFLEIHAELCG